MSKYYRQTSTPVNHHSRNSDSISRSKSNNQNESQKYKNKYDKTKSYNSSSRTNNSSANHHEHTDYNDDYSRSKSSDVCNESNINRSFSTQSNKSYDTNKDYDNNNNNNDYKYKTSNDSNLTLNGSTTTNIYYNGNRNKFKSDKPLFSRLFILCSKETSEQELNDAFQKYGQIQDIWIVRDHNTNMEKGYAYVKYAKASEATKALEEMNGTYLNSNQKRPLKIFISDFKNDQNQFDYEIYQRMQRLFVVIDKSFNKYDLRNTFKKYGEIKNAHIVIDRDSKESKGLGYVTFYKASDAAKALEECDKSYRAKFANLKPQELYKSESCDFNSNEASSNANENINTEMLENQTNAKNHEHYDHHERPLDEIKKEHEFYDTSNENDDIIPISSDESLNPNKSYDEEDEEDDDEYKCVRKKAPIENFSIKIEPEKAESKLTPDEKTTQPKRPHSNSNQPELNETILSLMKLTSIIKSVDTEKLNASSNNNKPSSTLIVKTQLSEFFLKKILDLIPGLNQVKISFPNNKANTNQYLVKYENELIANHAVQKLNGLEFPNGEKIHAEIFNEKNEIDLNQFKNIEEILKTLVSLNSALSSNQSLNNFSNDNKMLLDYLNSYLTQQEQLKEKLNSSVSILSSFLNQIQNINALQDTNVRVDQNASSSIMNNTAHNIKDDLTTVYIKCRNEIPKELFELVMGQFNNLNYVHLNDDRHSGYASFTGELDALLAVNTLNEREIANNYFRARLGKDFDDGHYQSTANMNTHVDSNSINANNGYFNSSRNILSLLGNHFSSDNHEESKSKRFCSSKF